MVDVSYYFDAHGGWLGDFAQSINRSTGAKIAAREGIVEFDDVFGKGHYRLVKLNEGISVLFIDCEYLMEFTFHRKVIPGNDCYRIIFNLDTSGPLTVLAGGGRTVKVGKSSASSIIFESQSEELICRPPVKRPFRMLQLIFNRDWLIRQFCEEDLLLQLDSFQAFVQGLPFRRTSNLDLRMRRLADEMFAVRKESYGTTQYLEGCACQLAASYFNNLIKEDLGRQAVSSSDVVRIVELTESIAASLGEPLPTLDMAAASCFMGRSRFASMFTRIYRKSYSEYFQSLRMKKARELLAEGYSIPEIGRKIGYVNIGFFTKAFSAYSGKNALEPMKSGKKRFIAKQD